MNQKTYFNTQLYGYIGFGVRGEVPDTGTISNVDIGDSPIVYFTGASPVLTGLVNINEQLERLLLVAYTGSGTLTLKANSTSSSASRRFDFTNDIVLYPKKCLLLIYDTESLRWRTLQDLTGGTSSSFDSVIINSNYTAKNNDIILLDSSNSTYTVSLPSSPSVGDRITFRDIGGANVGVVISASQNIEGVNDSWSFDYKGRSVSLVYSSSGWYFY